MVRKTKLADDGARKIIEGAIHRGSQPIVSTRMDQAKKQHVTSDAQLCSGVFVPIGDID